MPYFRIVTFGCKVNQGDTAAMALELARLGWRAAGSGKAADLILVNTCTVTARADQQARQAVRRLGRDYPDTALAVTGCYAQRAPLEAAALPGVRAVWGNREKAGLAWLIEDIRSSGAPVIRVGAFSAREPFHPGSGCPAPGHIRPFLKIQEGCDHRCSYCIVPAVRGPGRSLAPPGVEQGLKELAALGCQEVVLTGVDLGQYGRDLSPSLDLAGLMRRLAGGNWPFRVRLSSLEPQRITGELLEALAAFPQLCPHFHLPLQSGSAAVLAAMGRPYGPEDFRHLVMEIHRHFPRAALGLDVLVGYPGETPADFEATRSLVAALPVTYLHVFPFSPRPGTGAASLRPEPAGEVQARARVMRELGAIRKQAFYRAQIGQVAEVLVEGPGPQPGWLKGLSENYLRVVFPGPRERRNTRLKVRLRHFEGEALLGEVVSGPD